MTLALVALSLNFAFEAWRGGFWWAVWESVSLAPYIAVLMFLMDNHGIGDWTAVGIVFGLVLTAQVRQLVYQDVLGR